MNSQAGSGVETPAPGAGLISTREPVIFSSPPPNLNPIEADDLARYWEWPIDWWHQHIWPNFEDVQ